MELIERTVYRQVMLRKDEIVTERSPKNSIAVGAGIVFRKRPFPTCLRIVRRSLSRDLYRKDPLSGLLQDRIVHIGGIDTTTVVQPLLFQKDRHGIDLFSGRAACVPDPQKRIGSQRRHDL